MKQTYYISNSCVIKNNVVFNNDALAFESDAGNFTTFAKAAYKNFEIEYPKFFKMDNLSKLAFLGSEMVLAKYKEK